MAELRYLGPRVRTHKGHPEGSDHECQSTQGDSLEAAWCEGEHVEEIVEPLLRGPAEALADLVAVFGGLAAEDDVGFETAGASQAFEGFHPRRHPAALPSCDGRLGGARAICQLGLREPGALSRPPDEVLGQHMAIIAFLIYQSATALDHSSRWSQQPRSAVVAFAS